MRAAIVFVLLSATVFQRFGLNVGSGGASMQLSLIAVYILLAVAFYSGRLSIAVDRAVIYLVCFSIAAVSMLLNLNLADIFRSTLTSLIMVGLMFLPFVFVLKPENISQDDIDWVLEAFANIALFTAIMGVAQFALQFVIKGRWLFDFSPFLPKFLAGTTGFNSVIPVGGSGLFKSNGFFFREPSLFSFVMALGIVQELACRRRWWRLACLGAALLLTYSGTGLFALFVGLMFPFGFKTIVRYVGLAVIGALIFLLFGDALNLGFTLSRIGEFSAERSSAYVRYIAPIQLLSDTIDKETWLFWLGNGPGSILRTDVGFEFHDPTWAKLIYEYGVVGFLSFVALYITMLNRSAVPISVRMTMFAFWLFMGGNFLSADANHLAWVMVGFMPVLVSSVKQPASSQPQ